MKAMGVKSPGMSKGSDLMTLGKITTLLETMDRVLPSGKALVSACRPTMPPAPAWFSTTTLAPRALASAGWAARVMTSTPEPVALGRMMRTVLWANAARGRHRRTVSGTRLRRVKRPNAGCMLVSRF